MAFFNSLNWHAALLHAAHLSPARSWRREAGKGREKRRQMRKRRPREAKRKKKRATLVTKLQLFRFVSHHYT